ncbi:MAG: cell division protein FtsQ/DivIB [Gemmataceae bacterium]
MRRPLFHAALTLLACALLLGGLIAAGRAMRERLHDSPRHQFPVRDIDCPAPPEMEWADFLCEVQYQAELPDNLPLLDDELPARLASAFAKHAWVERVDRVSVGPGRAVAVRLTFRTPMLAVRYVPAKGDAVVREVDGTGVLLPKRREPAGVPRLQTAVHAPAGGAGQPWGDKLVERAAAVCAAVQPHQRELKLTRVDFADGEFRLRTDGGATVLWGHAPGEEADGEALAEAKVRRLRELYDKYGSLDRAPTTTIDVRTEK